MCSVIISILVFPSCHVIYWKWQKYSTPTSQQPALVNSLCKSTTVKTRSSAIAGGPCDASCQLKSCQLPRNSAETTCTTSPKQIQVMKLAGYSGAMCNKHVHSTMTRSTRFHCSISVINKPTTDELWISPVYGRLAVAKFSKSTK